MANQTKRILYLAESPAHEGVYITMLRGSGYDVHVAGLDDNDSGIAIDCAVKHMKDRQSKFDLVISGMVAACGYDNFNLAETNSGWTTGLAFAKRLREEGNKIPILIHELSTGLMKVPNYSPSQGVLMLPGSKERIPVLQKGGEVEPLIKAVRDMIGDSSAARLTPARDVPVGPVL